MKRNLYKKRQKQSNIKLILGIVIIILIITMIDSSFSRSSKNVFLECDTIEEKHIRYSCYKDVAVYARQHGATIEQLVQFIFETPRSNHLKYHSIGHATLITSNYDLDSVAEQCKPDNCYNGYYHGALQEWAEHNPLRVEEALDFLESEFCSLEHASCHHNIGHIHLIINKSFEESFKLCNKVEDNEKFSKCAEGVIHEQLIQSGTENFFERCSNYTGRMKIACYKFGSLLYPQWLNTKNVKDFLEVCHELNGKIPNELNYCYSSLSAVISTTGETINLEWCNNLNNTFKELCIKGLSSPQAFWEVSICLSDIVSEEGVETFGCEMY